MNKIVKKINDMKDRADGLRVARNDAAATLCSSGYSSQELAENVSVQASRVRHYVTSGEAGGEYGTVQSFVDAFNAWEDADARLLGLREQRNQMILEELAKGRTQTDVAKEFGMSQFRVSNITRNNAGVTLL